MAHRSHFDSVLVCVLLVFLASCGQPSGDTLHSTPSIEQANERVEKYLADAKEILPGTHEVQHRYEETAGVCDGGTDGKSDMVLATRTIGFSGLSDDQLSSYFEKFKNWWPTHGYRVLKYTPNYYLRVERNTDGFRMTLKANDEGWLFLTSTSPCVWPNGTPEPDSE